MNQLQLQLRHRLQKSQNTGSKNQLYFVRKRNDIKVATQKVCPSDRVSSLRAFAALCASSFPFVRSALRLAPSSPQPCPVRTKSGTVAGTQSLRRRCPCRRQDYKDQVNGILPASGHIPRARVRGRRDRQHRAGQGRGWLRAAARIGLIPAGVSQRGSQNVLPDFMARDAFGQSVSRGSEPNARYGAARFTCAFVSLRHVHRPAPVRRLCVRACSVVADAWRGCDGANVWIDGEDLTYGRTLCFVCLGAKRLFAFRVVSSARQTAMQTAVGSDEAQ